MAADPPHRAIWHGFPRWIPRLAGTVVWLGVHGCTQVDGGAVELSWALRPASSSSSSKFVTCDSGEPGTGPVTRIRLDWTVEGYPSGYASWRCDDNHGVTGFELPAGEALLTVTPECETKPADPATFTAPAAQQRRVILGDTVSLGAVELVLKVSYCGQQACICQ